MSQKFMLNKRGALMCNIMDKVVKKPQLMCRQLASPHKLLFETSDWEDEQLVL